MALIQKFDVGIKAFLLDRDLLLLLRESATGFWELPGGRIDVGEELLPQSEVLRRELREELGAGLAVQVGPPALTWVRKRPADFVFLVGRLCFLQAGEVRLSDEHDAFEWTDALSWKGRDLAPGYREAIEEFWRLLPGLRTWFKPG